MDITTTDQSLLRLLQLSSVSLPVGGYAFSQGLEYAIEVGWITDAESVKDWIEDQLLYSLACTDLPLLRDTMQASAADDLAMICTLNQLALACRETRELHLTDAAMGEALARLLRQLGENLPWPVGQPISFVVLFALVAQRWQLTPQAAALGLLWSWLENQVAAATKLVPLGQTQAQHLLVQLQPCLTEVLTRSADISIDQVGASLPGLAIASARHETQYTRLFRS
ncbi:urease accessory protein UreF [Pontibacter sp. JAM-7]|uniref:urease accessory protein UreF n=1 Tax=Pontibacter sp. JAM-7 TaxID=3366581 RepID=UPI003AF5BA1E